MTELQTDNCIGPRMPLLDYESGGVFEVTGSDDISVLLGDPLHDHTGEEYGCNGSPRAGRGGGNGSVADRWRDLGKDDKPEGKGKGRGKHDRDWGGGPVGQHKSGSGKFPDEEFGRRKKSGGKGDRARDKEDRRGGPLTPSSDHRGDDR